MWVEVYYNLHKKCLSIRHKGKVIKYKKDVCLTSAVFRVQPAGRARVIREKRKNVHAFVCGWMYGAPGIPYDFQSRKVIYDPYKYKTFVYCGDKKPIYNANYVRIKGKEITAYDEG